MFGGKPEWQDDTIKNIIGRAAIPLLILDQVWLGLFPKEFKSKRIIECEVRIKNLMKEESRLNQRHHKLKEDKKRCIDNINSLSAEVHMMDSKKAKVEMEKNKIKILQNNSQLVIMTRRMNAISMQIENENKNMLEETIKICYNLMKKSKNEIDTLIPKIEVLREALSSTISEKVRSEELYESTYNLLHKLIGRDMMDMLDKDKERQENKKWF